MRVDADTTVVLDEGRARRFDVRTDRAVLTDGQILSIDWNGATGHDGRHLRRRRRPPLRPADDEHEGRQRQRGAELAASQPDAADRAGAGAPVPLRPSPSPASARTSSTRRARRQLPASSTPEPPTPPTRPPCRCRGGRRRPLRRRPRRRGRRARRRRRGRDGRVRGGGQSCAGTLARPPRCRRSRPARSTSGACSARPRPRRHPPRPELRLRPRRHWWDGRVPTGATLDGRDGHVARSSSATTRSAARPTTASTCAR